MKMKSQKLPIRNRKVQNNLVCHQLEKYIKIIKVNLKIRQIQLTKKFYKGYKAKSHKS